LPSDVIVQAPPCGVKDVVQSGMNVLVRTPFRRVAADDDRLPGNHDVHAYVEVRTVKMMPVRLFHYDMASDDAPAELLELSDFLPDVLLEAFGGCEVAEGDAKGCLHDY
jgi:hypothetical protein